GGAAPAPPGGGRTIRHGPGAALRRTALRRDASAHRRPAAHAGPRPQHPGVGLGRGARRAAAAGGRPPPPAPARTTPASAGRGAPDELRRLGDDLPGRPVPDYKRRIGPWLLWRAGPAAGADARYWVARANALP